MLRTRPPAVFFRQALSSMISFLLEFIVMLLLTEIAHIHYLLSAFFGFIAGNSLLYRLSVRWIFNERRFENGKIEALLFFTLTGTSLLVNAFLLAIQVEVFKLSYIIAKPVGSVLVFLITYLIKKQWLFHNKIDRAMDDFRH